MGIRTQVTIQQVGPIIPQLLDEIFPWLAKEGIQDAGPAFIRYHVIDMAAQLDVEVGVPVAASTAGNSRILPGLLPAGRYASLIYTGAKNGIKGNAALLQWAAEQSLKLDKWQTEKGDAFGARVEFLLTGPDEEADPAKWQTGVAIRLADG
jgi:effector-binding domain-containing protein